MTFEGETPKIFSAPPTNPIRWHARIQTLFGIQTPIWQPYWTTFRKKKPTNFLGSADQPYWLTYQKCRPCLEPSWQPYWEQTSEIFDEKKNPIEMTQFFRSLIFAPRSTFRKGRHTLILILDPINDRLYFPIGLTWPTLPPPNPMSHHPGHIWLTAHNVLLRELIVKCWCTT